MKKKKKTDAPQGAQVLFRDLIATKRDGDLFFICKRSGDYTVCNAHTADFIRQAIRDLSSLLAEYDAERGIPPPTLEDVELSLGTGGVHWRALIAGHWGSTHVANWAVAEKVRDFLNAQLPDGGITPIPCQKAGRGAH